MPISTIPFVSKPARSLNLLLSLLAVFFAFASFAQGKLPFPATRVSELAAMLPAHPAGLGQPITNRAAWTRFAKDARAGEILDEARKLATTALPASPDDLFLDFSRTGNRDRWQKVASQRRGRLGTFTLAECMENRGSFIKPLEQTISALCAENTWVMPAHDRSLGNFKGTLKEMDLGACMLAWDLATADWLLGDKLSPVTRQLIRESLRRRVLDPCQAMIEGRATPVFWLSATHNWNAVCLAGVTGTALATLETPEQRAFFVAAAEHYIRNFLRGFTPDGYCSEGLGYWNYGFGHFVMLGESVRQATGGKVDFIAAPDAFAPALFARRAEVINDIYPSIADCSPGTTPMPALENYISTRFGLSSSAATAKPSRQNLYSTAAFFFLPEPLPRIAGGRAMDDSPLRSWFSNGGVLICRPASDAKAQFAAVLKGGHNAEHHNHNDVGSFSVILGTNVPICDPGAEVYTSRTFSDKRYDSDALNSFGHAVPVVAGKLQQPGANARAKVLRTSFTDTEDVLAIDFRSAYPVPSLEKLERTFTFRRGAAPALVVSDEAAFNQPEAFETAIVTWGDWKQVSNDTLRITDGTSTLLVKIETGGVPFEIKAKKLTADMHTRRKVQHLGISLKTPIRQATVTMTIAPAQAGR